MNNYEYIIASLPVISYGDVRALAPQDRPDVDGIIAEIRERMDEKDAGTLDFVLSCYDGATPGEEFYRKALSSRNHFIRDYFRYDLDVRNAKVAYLNAELGRPEGLDMVLPEEYGEFDDLEKVNDILSGHDILARERSLDDLMWNKAEELTTLHVFDLDLILGFVVRLEIIGRWVRLDENEGRALFRRLVEEIRNNR